MKTKIIVCSAVLGFLTAVPVYAGSASTQGKQAPAIIGDHATVNYIFNVIVENYQLAMIITGLLILVVIALFFKNGDTKRIKQKQKSGKNSTNIQVSGNVEINTKDV